MKRIVALSFAVTTSISQARKILSLVNINMLSHFLQNTLDVLSTSIIWYNI